MCASRRVARIAAQLSSGKVTKAIVRRVFGQNTPSVTASMSSRWKGSSSRPAAARRSEVRTTSGSTTSWAVSAARNDINPAMGASLGASPTATAPAAPSPQRREDAAVTVW